MTNEELLGSYEAVLMVLVKHCKWADEMLKEHREDYSEEGYKKMRHHNLMIALECEERIIECKRIKLHND